MEKTAVEWLCEQYHLKQDIEIVKQAKEMEKQQIIDAHGNQTKKSGGISNYTYILTGEEYYNKTFTNRLNINPK
jgi:hypothetical protein